MSWRAVVASLALVAVLLMGNALVAQVEGDIQHQLDLPTEEGGEGSVEGNLPPLKLNNLRLPEDLSLTLPPGTTLDPETLSKLTLPEDLDLTLPEGFDLSDLDFDLPEEFDLHLPEGSVFDPATGRLTLPNGGSMTLPDGSTFDFPPGTALDLPPELTARLLREGLPAGVLPRDASFHLEDLPPGLNVGMDPPGLPGNGTLHLPAGTQIQLPPGTEVPLDALQGLAPLLLPAGTLLDIPPGANGDGFPLPERDDQEGEDERPGNATSAREPPPGIPVATDIDTLPSRVPKGEAFFVEGYVRERDSGRDVEGAPVAIYMNETKEQPGVLVGQGQSDATGRFRIQVAPPTEKPAGQWQLVNHALPFTNAEGTTYSEGWGDPPFETFASTSWVVHVPARDGLQSVTPVRGELIDDTGAPVPFARVELLVDGVVVRQSTTSLDGLVLANHTFTSKGTHTVRLRFPGNDYYEASESDARTIVIEDVALDVPTTMRVERGERVTLAGRVLVSGVATPGERVDIGTPDGRVATVTTDSAGRFSTSWLAPPGTPLGAGEIVYSATDYGVSKAQHVDVWTRARLTLDATSMARIDLGVPARVSLVDLAGAPIAGQEVELLLAGPGGTISERVTTGQFTVERVLVPPIAADGIYTLSARAADAAHVEAAEASRAVEMGSLEVDWTLAEVVVRGSNATVGATVTFAGHPLEGGGTLLALFTPQPARTDGDGRVSWTVAVPSEAPLGPATATLTIPDLEYETSRGTRVVALPRIVLDTPATYEPGEPLALSVKLVDDRGDAVARHAMNVSARVGGETRSFSIVTDEEGAWATTIDTAGATREPLALAAHHPEQGDYLEADKTAAVTLASAVAGAPVVNPLVWGVPLMVMGVAGGAGVVVKRMRDAKRARLDAAPIAATATLLHAPGFDLDVGIPSGEPLVWGVGESLEITISPTGASAGRRSVRFTAPAVERTVTLEDGVQRFPIQFAEEGDARLEARRTDDAQAAPAVVELRIVDYRKEIAREFDLLLERARAIEPDLDTRATAQEVEWMLGHRLGPQSTQPLGDMSLVMDLANYSESTIGRAEYLRFIAATRAVDRLVSDGGLA